MSDMIEEAQIKLQTAIIDAYKRLFDQRSDLAAILACCGAEQLIKDGQITLSVSPLPLRTERTQEFKSYEVTPQDCLQRSPDELAQALCNWVTREADSWNVRMRTHETPERQLGL